MKKVGIITFHTALNYGAVLQTYALQTFLTEHRISNVILDYHCPYLDVCYKPFYVSDGKVLNSLVRGVLFGRTILKKRKVFQSFVSEKLVLSKKYLTNEEIEQVREQYRYFITGSDQVWSPISAGFDETYFLPFARDNQKHSYAASIGTANLTEDQILEFRRRLKGFKQISVRESSACRLIEQIDESKQIYIHVDPTLLLSQIQWNQLTQGPGKQEPYLLLFNVEKPINDVAYAKKLARERGLKLVYINERTVIKDKKIEYIKAPSPEQFLTLFANASVVVTNSFHGTVFSVIFKREFFVELDNQRQRNIRIEALLSKVKILDREIRASYENETFGSIDWDIAEEVLNEERERALKYFRKIDEQHQED